MEELLETLSAGYEQAVRSASQYAIELEPADLTAFREHLESLRLKLNAAESIEDWRTLEASFRGELRDYRDRAIAHVTRMRNETRAAASAMQLFADAITSTGTDHEEQLHVAVQQLKELAECDSLSQVKLGLHAAADTIVDSVTILRRGHQMAVAQLRDEIRLLHKKLDTERNSADLDRVTGVWNRQKLDAHLANLFQNEQAFCTLLIHIRHFKRLHQRYSPNLIESGLRALVLRFMAQMGDRGVVGRWNEENFLAVLQMEPGPAMNFSREATVRLSGSYSIQENGLSKNIILQAVTGVIERPVDCTSLVFQQRLLQISQLLAGSAG
jgi:GGDEF domain-containing protein